MFYRVNELKMHGKPDVNGIPAAPKESFISNIEIFLICIVIGFTAKHLMEIGVD